MRRFRPIVAVALLSVTAGVAIDAGATEATRHSNRPERPNALNWRTRNDFLAGVPDSALRLPPNLRSAHITAGPGKATPGEFVAAAHPRPGLRDVHRGSLATNASQGYDRFCDNMTAKVWDEPNGKRLKFDIKGKPGIAIAIPVQ